MDYSHNWAFEPTRTRYAATWPTLVADLGPAVIGEQAAYTADTLAAVLNTVADDILDVADCADEGVRDALNLLVNAALVYLDNGWREHDPAAARSRLEHVAAGNYDADLDEILDWINAS